MPPYSGFSSGWYAKDKSGSLYEHPWGNNTWTDQISGLATSIQLADKLMPRTTYLRGSADPAFPEKIHKTAVGGIPKTLRVPEKSCKLSRSDYIQYVTQPPFIAKSSDGKQYDWGGGVQGVFYFPYFSNDHLQDMWEGSIKAVFQQNSYNQSGADYFIDSGSNDHFNIQSAISGTGTSINSKRLKKCIISNRSVQETFINSCTLTTEYTFYLCKTRKPLQKGAATGARRPISLEDLFARMDEGEGGYNEFTNFGTITGASGLGFLGVQPTFENINGSGTSNYARMPITKYGAKPTNYSVFKKYYKIVKSYKCTLQPGECVKLKFNFVGKKILNAATWLEHYEYPGIAYTLMVIGRSQVVGRDSNSDVGFGFGQFQRVCDVSTTAKFVKSIIPVLSHATGSGLTTIDATSTEHVNQETDQMQNSDGNQRAN